MRCKKCNTLNSHPWLEPVVKLTQVAPDPDEPMHTSDTPTARWACVACGQYHNRDGTIYTNQKDE